MSDNPVRQAAELLAEAQNVVGFTGAGISAESGIPTFRDPGGIWDRFDPGELGTTTGIVEFAMKQPERIRDFLSESVDTFQKAQPNPGHIGLAELERMGILHSVITQNIDDLHSIAGNTRVFEVHGNLYRFRCLNCGHTQKYNREEILDTFREILTSDPFKIEMLMEGLPRCESCESLMRPDVVMFGEAVQQMPESFREAQSADVVIVLGTSGVVWPAAGVPYEARQAGARVIDINPTASAFRDITDVYINSHSGAAMPQILEELKRIRG